MADECEGRALSVEDSEEVERVEIKRPVDPVQARPNEPLMLSIKDAVGLLGLGRTTIYKLIGDGQLQAVKIGNRTLVKMASVRSLTQTQN
ncbi:helix-turn-helix domain-containing protein [Sphingomonas brevis]